MQARSVKGCSAARTDVWGQPKFAGPVEGTGAYTGSVKSFGAKGYGFIVMEDGVEMFFNIKDCVGSKPVAGDTVKFDIEESPIKPGSKQAGSHTSALSAQCASSDFSVAAPAGRPRTSPEEASLWTHRWA